MIKCRFLEKSYVDVSSPSISKGGEAVCRTPGYNQAGCNLHNNQCQAGCLHLFPHPFLYYEYIFDIRFFSTTTKARAWGSGYVITYLLIKVISN